MTGSSSAIGSGTCLGRTCLKWCADGDLTALDLNLVMQRLAQVDPEVAALQESSREPLPCPSHG